MGFFKREKGRKIQPDDKFDDLKFEVKYRQKSDGKWSWQLKTSRIEFSKRVIFPDKVTNSPFSLPGWGSADSEEKAIEKAREAAQREKNYLIEMYQSYKTLEL